MSNHMNLADRNLATSDGMWWETKTRIKYDRIAVKLDDKRTGAFRESILMPTDYYPLAGIPEVFHYQNTKPVIDPDVLAIFDSIKYEIGHCYTNTKNLIKKLTAAGYHPKAYAGWLFVSDSEIPVHHSWCMLDGALLDLSDDFTLMLGGKNGKQFEGKSPTETRKLIASFAAVAKKLPNSQRCHTVGTPTPFLFYVGSEQDPETACIEYRRLMRRYPGHDCERNCDQNGLNRTQQLLKKEGLMK